MMFFESLNFFIKKNIKRNPVDFFILVFFVIIESFLVFASFIAVVPFADFIVDPSLSDPNKFTKSILEIFYYFDFKLNYFNFALFFIAIIFLTAIFSALILYQIYRIKMKFEVSLAEDLLNSILFSKWNYLNKLKPGKILNIFTKEIPYVGSATRSTAQIFSNFFKLLIYLYIPFLINSAFTLQVAVTFLIFGIPFLYLNLVAKKLGQKRSLQANVTIDKLSETYHALKLILGFNKSNKTLQNNLSLVQSLAKLELKSVMLTYVIPLSFKPVAIIIILIFFGGSFSTDKISEFVGIFWGMYGAIPLVSTILNNILLTSNFYPSFKQIDDVIENCVKFQEKEKGKIFEDLEKEIRFENISFNYKNENIVVKNFNLIIPQKKITTFFGKTGSGKSTIVDLILGFQKPVSGEIYYDDIPSENLNIKSFREKVGYVPQDSLLFNMSIKENIFWSNSKVNEDEIFHILKDLDARDFVNDIEDLNIVVGERGSKLSGGQRQKIALARALIKKPNILILDEALSSIDNVSSKKINDHLKNLSKEITIINITHKIDHCKNSDKIFFKDGNIFKELEKNKLTDLV